MEIKETLTNRENRISHIPLINQVFSHEKTKCIKNNDGLYACVNGKCTISSPYVCSLKECKCGDEEHG